MDRRLGFVVNPIAGLGGRVGLKGTDGVAEEALRRGAQSSAPRLGLEALRALPLRGTRLRWFTAGSPMGAQLLKEGRPREEAEIVHLPEGVTTADDTRRTVEALVERNVEIILFVGGDGTARDVAEASRGRVPILGVPAGVKMHSSVFALHAASAGEALGRFLAGELRVAEGEILDLDEEAYRRGEWSVRFYGTVPTLQEATLIQVGKALVEEVSEDEVRAAMARYLGEMMEAEPKALFLLGPGGTIKAMADELGIPKTLLGVDAVLGGHLVASDVDEAKILDLLKLHPNAHVVVSPIGAQGFVFGRGNQQFSPRVIGLVGPQRVITVATPAKLNCTPLLRVDTGDPALDAALTQRRYLAVVVGYRTRQLHPAE